MPRKPSTDAVEEREHQIAHFLDDCRGGVKDPRSLRGRSYSLSEIFLLVLCAQTSWCGYLVIDFRLLPKIDSHTPRYVCPGRPRRQR